MEVDLAALPEPVRALIAAQAATIARQPQELTERSSEIARLKAQLAKLRRMQFGRSSEKLDTAIAQLELALADLEEQAAAANSAPEQPEDAALLKPARRPLPAHLPREVVKHAGPRACRRCGGDLSRLGEDATEVLDYQPAAFRVIRHVREKFACRGCEAITQAPAPSLRSAAAAPPPGCSRMCWWPSSVITCRCIARARSTPVPGWRWNARRWPTGSARSRRCCGRWSMRCNGTCWPATASTPMTRRCRCWRRATARPGPDGSGAIYATSERMAAPRPRQCSTATAPIAAASIRARIWHGSAVCFRPMATPGSTGSTARG